MDEPRDYHTEISQTIIICNHLQVEQKNTKELIYKTETES